MTIQYLERLTMRERFKLIQIAHESNDIEIKCAAIELLRQDAGRPHMLVKAAQTTGSR